MSRIGIVAVCALCLAAPAGAKEEPFRKTLISVAQNIDVPDWESPKDATPACPVPWSVKKLTLHGGKQEGVEEIVVDNGKLRCTIVPTRGMGVLSAGIGETRFLGWDSPVKEVVHPRLINLQARGGLGWLEGFNEGLCRCGLESMGHPGTDKFINNVGDEATMDLTLHGRVANLPAQEVEVVVDREAPFRIHVRGRIDEKAFYGPNLELQTELSTVPGSAAFRIDDVLTNRADRKQEIEILYHSNFGRPLLEEGATFVGPVRDVTPFNAHAAEGAADYAAYAGPQAGFVEKVYCLRLYADKMDRTKVMLRNKAGDRAASLSFSVAELPYLTLWKNTLAEKDGYVTGLEPGTNYPYNRRIERQFGRVTQLPGGGERRFSIEYAFHQGEDEVSRAAEKIAVIQGDRKTTVADQPAKIPD